MDSLFEQVTLDGKSEAYSLRKLLGYGGFGQVFMAVMTIDRKSTRKIAVKHLEVMPPDLPGVVLEKKLKSSWKDLWNLDHPNIIKYFGAHVTQEERVPKIALLMEYCSGGSLDRLLVEEIPASHVPIYIKQVLQGLSYLHNLRIIHTDLKPSNILLFNAHRFGAGKLKICDFDDPIILSNAITRIGDVNKFKGSMPYVSPEMAIFLFDGDSKAHKECVGRKTDIWSLGCVILDLAAKTYPRDVEVVLKELEGKDEIFIVQGDKYHELERLLKRGGVQKVPDWIAPNLKDLVDQCLTLNQQARPSAENLLRAPYFDRKIEINALPELDLFSEEDLQLLSVGGCRWKHNKPPETYVNLFYKWPGAWKFDNKKFISDMKKAIEIYNKIGKVTYISVTLPYFATRMSSIQFQSILQDISPDVIELRFYGADGFNSLLLTEISLPNLIHLGFDYCNGIRLFDGHFDGLPSLRAMTFLSSTIESMQESFLQNLPSLRFFGLNMRNPGEEVAHDTQYRVSKELKALHSAEYSWLKLHLRINPHLTDLSEDGVELWTVGEFRSRLKCEEAPNDFFEDDMNPKYREASLAMPRFEMYPVSAAEEAAVQQVIDSYEKDLSASIGRGLWSIRCNSSVPSSKFKELITHLARLKKSHPILLLLGGNRKDLNDEIFLIQDSICFLTLGLIGVYNNLQIQELNLPNLLELRFERCTDLVLTKGSLDACVNLRSIIMDRTTISQLDDGVFDKLQFLQLLSLHHNCKKLSRNDLSDQFHRLQQKNINWTYVQTFLKERSWLTGHKLPGEIWSFSDESTRWESQGHDASYAFLAQSLILKTPQQSALPVFRITPPLFNLLEIVSRSQRTSHPYGDGIIRLNLIIKNLKNKDSEIDDMINAIAAVKSIYNDNPVDVLINCVDIFERDLLKRLSSNVMSLTIESIDKFDGSLLSRMELSKLVDLDFIACTNVILRNKHFSTMPALRIITFWGGSTLAPPEEIQNLFGEIKHLTWLGLHRGLRNKTKTNTGNCNWEGLTKDECQYLFRLYKAPEFEGVRQLLREKPNLTKKYEEGEINRFVTFENTLFPSEEMFTLEEIESLLPLL
ncbi:putative Mitogen-activated protein kinase kinase kinase YODA [Hypsibius exemplaris]|uniref:Mitogen-activated protein kinase kinase kinase YODA n=1 Tax=Hypsibius exemplaris TaxID=2072580 RepID=A0A1W0WBM8_HYPEX|nr:putative Mitogen-activated protein kinase kinase kinase YODA [Hypsibius exemplaris]